jgi:hypothetical protein
MTSIPASVEFGIIVRRGSLAERGIELEQVYQCMGTSVPCGISDELITFGPSFGVDAQREFIRRLEELGLNYFEDFFDVNIDRPAWCGFMVTLESLI